ncbi:hypothetical protein Nepgr_003943 [Nepenthes gracilis]|uniref:Uncharacterized protein n=1 Tax=Nepenthes gracilis TaxID=150966 RepID=A0AAD3S0J9_NEPGR|nr:hypothetical protein Nepgr_003943 [Nepenthes gracilis]
MSSSGAWVSCFSCYFDAAYGCRSDCVARCVILDVPWVCFLGGLSSWLGSLPRGGLFSLSGAGSLLGLALMLPYYSDGAAGVAGGNRASCCFVGCLVALLQPRALMNQQSMLLASAFSTVLCFFFWNDEIQFALVDGIALLMDAMPAFWHLK